MKLRVARWLALPVALGMVSVRAGLPENVAAPEVLEALRYVRSFTALGLSREYVVENERVFDGPVLAVERLVFRPGGCLVLGTSKSERPERFIVARQIMLPAEGAPACIRWERGTSHPPPTSVWAQAAQGQPGPTEGAAGLPGQDGNAGGPGAPGRNAPTVYVIFDEARGRPLHVDLVGQDGGVGGPGQTGGDGGQGRTGRPGVGATLPFSQTTCLLQPSDGGRGGRGGRGGDGGSGGAGGNGGTFLLLSLERSLGRAAMLFEVETAPGQGGPGGAPGLPGKAGNGGPPGSTQNGCPSSSPGAPGDAGPPGSTGPEGRKGAPGVSGATVLTRQQLSALLND
jgi:hypothetical protein